MNVVYYLGSFPKLSESFILNEIYELKKRGHNVAVCALREPDEEIVHEEFAEIDIPTNYIGSLSYTDAPELLSTKTARLRLLKDFFYPTSLKDHFANIIRAKKLIEFVDTLYWNPDHIHSHFASISKFAAQYASDYYEIPFTITTHAFDLFQEPVGKYTAHLLRRSDRIVTISEYNRQYIRERFSLESPVDVVRAGIRLDKFAPTGSTKSNRVLTISRLVEKKGIRYALEAVQTVAEEIRDLEYHIVGSGELKPNLVQQADRLGISDNITFLDNVTDEQLHDELDEARCFLLPCVVAESGDRDGIPVALMEAMAMKTPPVSTRVSGIPELVKHGENGFLTKQRDSEATANALLELLQDDSKWNRCSERARETVSAHFNVETEAEKLEASFEAAGGGGEQADRRTTTKST